MRRRPLAGPPRARRAWAASALLLAGLSATAAHASGASPYLPLNLSPEIEREVERVLILGNSPVLTRPVAVGKVLQALPAACRRDAALCARVQRYLDRYFGTAGVTHASIAVAVPAIRSTTTLPNQRGERADSPVDGSAVVFYRPADHLLLTGGAVGYAGTDARINPAGTMVSVGDEYAQLDIGYRDHWLSPLTDSSMLQSTEAPTMPSVTLSNQQLFTPLGIDYQFFLASMSHADQIAWHNGYTHGNPRLAGAHLGIEPVAGWAIAGNVTWQYGGGARPGSLGGLLGSLFSPTSVTSTGNADGRFSDRNASITSAYTFLGPTPLETYVEYAGRDSFQGTFYRFHQTGISAGVHIPELLRRFDLTVEASEWQNDWYTDYVWLEGMTEDGYVTGHWGADWRSFGNSVGASTEMVQLGFPLQSGDLINLRYRTLQNAGYAGEHYRRAHMITAEYAQPRNGYTRGLQIDAGRDVFGANFLRISAFLRLDGGDQGAGADIDDDVDGYADSDVDSGAASAGGTGGKSGGTTGGGDTDDQPADAGGRFERFVDVGISSGRLGLDLQGFTAAQEAAPLEYHGYLSPHVGIGFRHAVSTRGDLGVRAELDDFDGPMVALRILDYRYRVGTHVAAGAFLGVARYSAPTPTQGYYGGLGLQWRNLLPRWDLSLDYRYFDRLQRDKLLPTDPQNGDPVEYYTMRALSLYLSRRF